ncbi:uncharacterized protein [Aristolochia californica]|uniref:uncharacterized protein n=1 Tax=Aristolochia californica TaxID=171875 RepID=UPI0035D618C8
MADALNSANLFSLLIAEIKAYSGNDPLLPWLRGIKKMKEVLPPELLKEKLPRFLQKCACTFEGDKRYKNDLRYLRVWIQLMDFVEDPKGLLRRMEANQVGIKLALFYQAYALYYEKLKRFEESEKMFHLGVQNLAEPAEELHKSYEQFLQRMEQYRKRKARKQAMRASMAGKAVLSTHGEKNIVANGRKRTNGEGFLTLDVNKIKRQAADTRGSKESSGAVREKSNKCSSTMNGNSESKRALFSAQVENRLNYCDSSTARTSSEQLNTKKGLEKQTSVCGDDTVVVKFVGSAIVGKSEEAEDACHHGLVDPTINTKEVMNAINNMFQEPLEIDPKEKRRSQRSQPKVDQDQPASKGFEVFVDENLDGAGNCDKENATRGMSQFQFLRHSMEVTPNNHRQESLMIFVDSEDENDGCSKSSSSQDRYSGANKKVLKDDTVICRFVGSTVCGESEIENACHHGLVDPTVNLKEAMDDINSMFGKPLDFVKSHKRRKPSKPLNQKQDSGGFVIFTDDNEGEKGLDFMETNKPNKPDKSLNEKQEASGFQIFTDSNLRVKPLDLVMTDELQKQPNLHNEKQDAGGFVIFADDDLEEQQDRKVESSTSIKSTRECDLFEPTLFTKEAIDDINEMFAMPLDF